MKKKISAAAVLLSLLSISAAGTLAYFTDSQIAHNVITSGEIEIKIVETQKNMDISEGQPPEIPYADPVRVMPGQTVSKIVRIENMEETAYIRARFDMSITDNLSTDVVNIAIGPDWKEKDGWYYYNSPVSLGTQTTPLFETVVFDGPTMTNEYQESTLTIDVYAQAVQAKNNGDSALAAQGWPN